MEKKFKNKIFSVKRKLSSKTLVKLVKLVNERKIEMLKHRPEDGGEDWDDNALSNSLAWLSSKILPNWCQHDSHWTNRLADKVWAECACCLVFRGVFLGACVTAPLGVLVGAILF